MADADPDRAARARAAFDDLDAGDAVRGTLFGKPCLKADGSAFACQFRDGVAFKLPGDDHAAALALPGAGLFDPSGRGRPMRQWVQVPVDAADRWEGLAAAARAYVAG